MRAYATSNGIKYHIANFGGARTEQIVAQLIRWRDEAVAAGEPWYRVSPFTVGKHARGAAFDIRIDETPEGMTDDEAYAFLGKQAPQFGLIWGGRFRTSASQPAADPFHFESQQSLMQLDARWAEWVKDPKFPRGFIDIPTMIVLAIVGVIIAFFLLR